MVVRGNNGSVSQCSVLSTSFSDHDAIVGLTALNNSLTHWRVVSSRNLRKINSAEMQADIQHLLDTELAGCTDTELADRYSEGLRRVLDQHDPPTSRKVTNRPSASWRPDSVRTAKREFRQGERKWRSSGLTVYKEFYSTKLIACTESVRKAKRQYYNDVISNCPSSKQLYNVTIQLLGRTEKTSLRNNIPSSYLPDTFCQFFNKKVEQIRNDIYDEGQRNFKVFLQFKCVYHWAKAKNRWPSGKDNKSYSKNATGVKKASICLGSLLDSAREIQTTKQMNANQKWPSYCETYEMNFHRRWKGDDGIYFGYRFWFHCLYEQNGLFWKLFSRQWRFWNMISMIFVVPYDILHYCNLLL